MSVSIKMMGFRELEANLAQLPAGTAKGVARRLLKKELKPIAATANAFWPGSDNDVFKIGSRIVRRQMGDSVQRRGRSVVNMFVGSDAYAPHAHLIEFGTGPRYQKTTGRYVGQVAPGPMLQPAWDMHKHAILRNLSKSLWEEIEKTQARRAARAARARATR